VQPSYVVQLSNLSTDSHIMSIRRLSTFAGFYSERGYTTVEIDLGLPETSLSSSQLMEYFENGMKVARGRVHGGNSIEHNFYSTVIPLDLRSHIRLAAIPFPPIIFARSMGSLITQTYISSNPASGLVLLSPPPNTASIDVDPSLKEFDFEPKFPLLIVETKDREKVQRGENRLVKDWDVDLLIVDELESQDALIGVEKWMDEVGV
jgi:hypothetical protein